MTKKKSIKFNIFGAQAFKKDLDKEASYRN